MTRAAERDGPNAVAEPYALRWRALAVLGLFQFMLVLDMTVVNVALPRIHNDLGFTDSGLAWVVNGYILAAAGFLLLGGRLADRFGQRRIFLIGVALFALASLACGAAMSPAMLVAGRFVQGFSEALAAPASLGLVILLFQDPRERMKALGIWGGISGLGGVLGSVISGLLVNFTSWRFIFLINLPVAVIALILVPLIIKKSNRAAPTARINYASALLGTAGLGGIVFGLLQAASSAWGSVSVLGPLTVGVVLLAAMGVVESRSAQPLIPARFFADRIRAVTYLAIVTYSAVFFAYVFIMTLFEQQILHFSPLLGGLSYLPLGLGIGAGLALSNVLMPRLGAGLLLGLGLLGASVGLFLSGGIHVHGSYAGIILPGMIVLGFSSGVIMPAVANAAFHGINDEDASLASAIQNVVAQIGGALGLAVLVTVALRQAQAQSSLPHVPPSAFTDGYALAFDVSSAMLAIVGIVALLGARTKRSEAT